MVCRTTDQKHCCKREGMFDFDIVSFFLVQLQTIGGNICNASPISDLNPVLVACGAKLNLASQGICMYT